VSDLKRMKVPKLSGDAHGLPPATLVRDLAEWAELIQRWCSDGQNVSAYFNNDACGYAVEDAQTLKRLLGEVSPPEAGSR
jgi:uncharacterized protein YecE (DUF72 family)